MSSFFTLNWKNILGAVVSAVLVALLTYIGNLTDVFSADFHSVLNIVVLTFVTSLLKALGTDSKGNFVGAVPVK